MLASALVLLLPLTAAALTRPSGADRATAARTVDHTVKPGECFAGILGTYGVGVDDIGRWARAARPKADFDVLSPGHTLRLSFDHAGQVRALRYDVDDEQRVSIERVAGDRLAARSEPLPVAVHEVGVRAVIKTTFYHAARQAGIPDPIISQMVDLLSWELTFKSDVHRGDRFRVVYETRTALDGRPLRPGRILAVDYAGRTESLAAYLYEGPDGSTYVDDEGHRLDGAPLRYPLEFTRITSAFSQARFHPILRRTRPHRGVDFAAPSGTPVRAIGPGVVHSAGVKSGFGNHVELDHGREFVSAYSHLKGIAPGVRAGTRVQRGQLIGWVGQTGLATGPHLHFAIFERGEYVDPLTIKHPPQLAVVDRRVFKRLRHEMLAQLDSIAPGGPATASAPEIGLSPLAQADRVGPILLTF
ncbi:MAG: LysM peptidoglycan-binding domain-containing M23 family metallopeptidase [Candidatus Binatia bacterium]